MLNTVDYRLESFAPAGRRVQTDEATLNKISAALPTTLF
jgi:phenolic acid decarboxylase